MEHKSYIRVYGATKAPHFLSIFFLYRLVLQEITYQIVIHGFGEELYREKKAICPMLPLCVES
jgi:hypothetical protein